MTNEPRVTLCWQWSQGWHCSLEGEEPSTLVQLGGAPECWETLERAFKGLDSKGLHTVSRGGYRCVVDLLGDPITAGEAELVYGATITRRTP